MSDTKTPPVLPTMVLPMPVKGFRFDKTKDGWELIENVALEGESILTLDTFLREDESSVIGHTMLERAKEDAEEKGARTGQLHAERMLEQQDKIPAEWQNFYLVFTGTVWRGSSGDVCVPFLCWGGVRWRLYWDFLDGGWSDSNRLVRLGK